MSAPDIVAIAAKKPRETAGADTVKAFDFQMNVSMALILDLHQTGDHYLALFDHHDDLVLFVGEEGQQEVSFYQVKSTTDLTWTPPRLSARGKKGDNPRSIVGKAFYNVVQFGPDIRRASILSNRPLNASLAPDGKPAPHDGEIVLSELSTDDHAVIVKALKEDFPAGFDDTHIKLLMFERVPFDPESHRDTVRGRVVTLLKKLHPDSVACADPFYDSLLGEVSGCTGDKARSASSAELKRRKGLDRKDVDALIGRVQARVKTPIEWWPSISSEMSASGMGGIAIERTRVGCLQYWRARQRGDDDACELGYTIKAAMQSISVSGMDSVLKAAVALRSHGLAETTSSMYNLQSAMIVEVMEFMT